jgi:hypothetical protein
MTESEMYQRRRRMGQQRAQQEALAPTMQGSLLLQAMLGLGEEGGCEAVIQSYVLSLFLLPSSFLSYSLVATSQRSFLPLLLIFHSPRSVLSQPASSPFPSPPSSPSPTPQSPLVFSTSSLTPPPSPLSSPARSSCASTVTSLSSSTTASVPVSARSSGRAAMDISRFVFPSSLSPSSHDATPFSFA